MASRKTRGKMQQLYFVDNIDIYNEYSRKYAIMGTTGNVYNVTIKTVPECTCPDYVKRKNRCKHIYFVLIRLMHVSEENEDKTQFNNFDLLNMFSSIPNVANNICVSDITRAKYESLKHNVTESNRIMVDPRNDDDICPICFDDLDNGEELDYCKYVCGKQIHLQCFKMWCKVNKATCVFCRTEWLRTITPESEYINII